MAENTTCSHVTATHPPSIVFKYLNKATKDIIFIASIVINMTSGALQFVTPLSAEGNKYRPVISIGLCFLDERALYISELTSYLQSNSDDLGAVLRRLSYESSPCSDETHNNISRLVYVALALRAARVSGLLLDRTVRSCYSNSGLTHGIVKSSGH